MKRSNVVLAWMGILCAVLSASPTVWAEVEFPASCRRACERLLDETEHPTQSGSAVNAYEECLERCNALEAAQNAFRACIQHATTDEEREACRAQYREDRPE